MAPSGWTTTLVVFVSVHQRHLRWLTVESVTVIATGLESESVIASGPTLRSREGLGGEC